MKKSKLLKLVGVVLISVVVVVLFVQLFVSADGIDSYVVSMLHFNGTNGSTTITDETGKTWTANGNAQICTSQSKFGGSSLYVDGNEDLLSAANSQDFDFSNQDFTIDFWIKRARTSINENIIGQCNSTGSYSSFNAYIQVNTNNTLTVYQSLTDSTWANFTTSATISDTTTWHHIAYERYGSYLYLYIDGILSGSVSIGSKSTINSSDPMCIGRCGSYNGYYFYGYFDDFRISKGIARWTSDFPSALPSEYTTPIPTNTPTPAYTSTNTPVPTPTPEVHRYTDLTANVGTYDPPSIANCSQVTANFSVPDVIPGDFVQVRFSDDLHGIIMSGYVSSSNTVTVVFFNGTGGAVDLPQGTVRVKVNNLEHLYPCGI